MTRPEYGFGPKNDAAFGAAQPLCHGVQGKLWGSGFAAMLVTPIWEWK